MSTQSPLTRDQLARKRYLQTDAIHRLETALGRDTTVSDYMENARHRLAHILGKLDRLPTSDQQEVIDQTRKCIEDNSPNGTVRSQLLESLDRSQAA
jgi:hypothetical protein